MRGQRHRPLRHARNEPRQLINRALDLDELTRVPRLASKLGLDSQSSLGEHLQSRPRRKVAQEAKSLVSFRTTAARVLARNAGAIPLQVLSQMRWAQIRFVWEVIELEMLDSLDVFVKFATAFPEDITARKTLNVSVAELPQALSLVISHLNRDHNGPPVTGSIPWSLHLDLSHVPVESEVLLQLGRVPGLSVLKINDSNIDDSTIGHWARSQSASGFAHLRMLDIRANPLRNLHSCLQKLVHFPRLQLIKCDAIDSWSGPETTAQQSRLQNLWQDLQSHKGAVIEMNVHLGSRADRRPLQVAKEETIIDAPLARGQFSSEQREARLASTSNSAQPRNKKRQKKLGGSQDIWQHVLSKA